MINRAQHPLKSGYPPSYASAWGQDNYGIWVEVTLFDIVQRLRWIPAGQFEMGSETGNSNEKPLHDVSFSQGFWLFDTPVTQELWQAVMGDNHSHFEKKTKHPVETVSWHDSQQFITKINTQRADFQLALPSEAEWEYACRADTTSDNYAGDQSALDAIAWYGINSQSSTHPVAQKKPNQWGLYDMLGNVREWTEDHWHSDYQQAPDNGQTWFDSNEVGGSRVLRGGSWLDSATFCRSAVRDGGLLPGNRLSYVGFRCVGLFARVQE